MRAIVGLTLALVLVAAAAPAFAGEEDLIRELREEVRRLRDRVDDLEGRLGEPPLPAEDGTDLDVLGEAMERISEPNVVAPLVRGLSISGQIRLQAEDQLNFDLNDDRGDAYEFVRQRVRVAFDADVANEVRAFVTIQDSRLWGEEHGVAGNLRGVDLREGYVDLREILCDTVIRIGRQELLYGDQRLISPLDWSHVGRSWDGVRLMWTGESGFVHVFATRIDERGLGSGQDENEDFLGVYGSFSPAEGHTADAYLLFRRNRDSDDITGEDGAGGHEDLWTLGGRYRGREGGFDYVVEGAVQFGDFANDDVFAWMLEAEAGYTFVDAAWKPRVGLGWTLASGDDDATDGDRGTFDPLYTFGHFYLGHADRVGRKNVNSPRLFLDLVPAEGFNVSLDTHFFWLMTSDDALYHAGGGVLRGAMPGADEFVGWEIDLHAKWKWTANVTIWFGWAHFFAGEFLDDTGAADDADFLFVQLTVNF